MKTMEPTTYQTGKYNRFDEIVIHQVSFVTSSLSSSDT